MDFSQALTDLKAGHRLTRTGWNGRGMWVVLHRPFLDQCLPFLMLRTVDGQYVPWIISQTDALAEDWERT